MSSAVKKLTALAMALLLVSIAACAPVPEEVTPSPGPSPETSPSPSPAPEPAPPEESGTSWGILEFRATDPPPADVSSAIVHLTEIQVHYAPGTVAPDSTTSDNVTSDNATSDNTTSDNTTPDNAAPADTGGWITVIEEAASFDLLEVVDGVEAILGSANVTAGKYTQIRITVDRVEVVTTTGENVTAEVPSGKLKIVRPFTVGRGETTVLTLDFNGEKSLVVTGAGKFFFKPVVKLLIENGDGEAEEPEEADEAAETEAETEGRETGGTILEVQGNEVTIELENGDTVTLLVNEDTVIELGDGYFGTAADLQSGAAVEAVFNPDTGAAITIEMEAEEEAELEEEAEEAAEPGEAKVEGVILEIQGSRVTIGLEDGSTETLLVNAQSVIELADGSSGTLAGLGVGDTVEATFDPVSGIALVIEAE